MPSDWDDVPLQSCAERIVRGASPRPIEDPKWFDNRSSVGWLRISDATSSGRFLTETQQRLSTAGIRHSRPVSAGGLVMSICATVGRPIETSIDVCIHDGFVHFDKPSIDQGFLYYVLTDLEPRWSKRGQTGSQMNLNTGLIKATKVAVPRDSSEQSSIATALGDVDALLAAQDALIAKKRAIKQGAMQELLTGKRRLPGFSGEWEVRRLGSLGQSYGGLVGKTKNDFGQGDAQYVTFVNVMANIVVDVNAFDKVNISPGELQNRVLKNDLLFNGSSETPEEVAMCALVVDEVKNLYLNSFCFGFRLNDGAGIDSLFLTYYMRGQIGRDLIKSLAQGSTRYNLSKPAFLDGELILPSADEQVAIANVLSDMGAEIAALEAKRAKTAQLKQGMMQTLLTGRLRLV
ncbi:restriction endonuclease subunit S [Pseudoxanthomonas daejeonensis]|uniref:Restriction endonuclease subunit S n=2 Tax=Pseudoxanthomonas daejeonensis TaxID=266062 RepID=A0ABQ6Z379_9GAMM|nr:restriction endonuclease subunit S [Pseudoxanthomonas daejeonensis]